MNKTICTIGYEIPGKSEDFLDYTSDKSLMDFDILLISPDSLYPRGDWVSFTTSDEGCYNVAASKTYKQKMSHLKKEMIDFLNSGKNIFILLSKEEEYKLAYNVSTIKKGQHTYNTESYSNYNFLPINVGILTSASGKHVEFSGNPIFSDFFKKFKKYLEYQVYLENTENAQTIFTGKDETKFLGAVYKVGSGHLVTLPYIKYDEDKFTKYNKKEEKNYWTSEAIKFGNIFVDCFLNIDRQLTQESEKTPSPKWIEQSQFSTKEELKIEENIVKNKKDIEKIKSKNKNLYIKLTEEQILKDLLFEQGKPLENAVIGSLKILGYEAENYDDGELELDQVINSPEGHRFIGECEGKDNKDINITKFRQLLESLNADFAKDKVEEKAFGILFGNPERLKNPVERTLDFTKKCKIGAEREKIALIKTIDLFIVAKFLKENKNETYKKICRKAIYDGLGKIVQFPEIPPK